MKSLFEIFFSVYSRPLGDINHVSNHFDSNVQDQLTFSPNKVIKKKFILNIIILINNYKCHNLFATLKLKQMPDYVGTK